jgi:hypothetical protein
LLPLTVPSQQFEQLRFEWCEGLQEGLRGGVWHETPPRAGCHLERGEVDETLEAMTGPRLTVQTVVLERREIVGHQRAATLERDLSRALLFNRDQIELMACVGVAGHRQRRLTIHRHAPVANRPNGDLLRRQPARHAVVDHELDLAREQLTAQLARQVRCQPPRLQLAERGLVQSQDRDLGEGGLEHGPGTQWRDLGVARILAQTQQESIGPFGACTDLHEASDAPEAEQSDAVLAQHHQLLTLGERQPALVGLTNGRGDALQGLATIELGKNAKTVVADRDRALTTLGPPGDGDVRGPRVE